MDSSRRRTQRSSQEGVGVVVCGWGLVVDASKEPLCSRLEGTMGQGRQGWLHRSRPLSSITNHQPASLPARKILLLYESQHCAALPRLTALLSHAAPRRDST